jgi:hypothetical protein
MTGFEPPISWLVLKRQVTTKRLRMRHTVCVVFFLHCAGLGARAYSSWADFLAVPEAEQAYYPARDQWERRTPAELGMHAGRLDEAISWARTQQTAVPKDLSDQVRMFGRLVGPVPAERGDINGIVIRNGYIVVLAVGDEEIGRPLRGMDQEERLKIKVGQP